jgi:ATP-dependent Lhr-like helicase
VKWFSKFSQCLPEPLAKKTILEKGVDLQGLKRELNKVDIQKAQNR